MTNNCNDYCLNYGCQGGTNCPARAERIERAIQAGMRKTIRQRTILAAKTILKHVAFGMLSLFAVLMMAALVVVLLNGSKP